MDVLIIPMLFPLQFLVTVDAERVYKALVHVAPVNKPSDVQSTEDANSRATQDSRNFPVRLQLCPLLVSQLEHKRLNLLFCSRCRLRPT